VTSAVTKASSEALRIKRTATPLSDLLFRFAPFGPADQQLVDLSSVHIDTSNLKAVELEDFTVTGSASGPTARKPATVE
jgi:hypothetical protein